MPRAFYLLAGDFRHSFKLSKQTAVANLSDTLGDRALTELKNPLWLALRSDIEFFKFDLQANKEKELVAFTKETDIISANQGEQLVFECLSSSLVKTGESYALGEAIRIGNLYFKLSLILKRG